MRWRSIFGWGSLGIYLLGFGFVTGMAAERMRFDRERRAIVGRLEERSARLHAYLMALERGDERRAEAQSAKAPRIAERVATTHNDPDQEEGAR